MKKYLDKVKDLISLFLSFDVQHVLRAENTSTDALSKLVESLPFDLQKDIYFEVLKKSNFEEPQLVQQISEEPSQTDPLLKYLQQSKLLPNQKEAWNIIHQAPHQMIYDKKFSKHSFSLPLLKCLHPLEVDYVLREVHKKVCENYLRGRSLAYKILQQDYSGLLCSRIRSSLYKIITIAKEIMLSVSTDSTLDSNCYFLAFCLVRKGHLGSIFLGDYPHKFLLIAIDYFIKQVETKPLATSPTLK